MFDNENRLGSGIVGQLVNMETQLTLEWQMPKRAVLSTCSKSYFMTLHCVARYEHYARSYFRVISSRTRQFKFLSMLLNLVDTSLRARRRVALEISGAQNLCYM